MLARKLDRNGSHICWEDETIDLRAFREIVAVAYGKAALAMAEGLRDALEPEFRCVESCCLPPPLHPPEGWELIVGGHPTPRGELPCPGRAILDRLAQCDDEP